MSSTNITVLLQEYKQLETYAQAAGYNSVLDLEQTLQDQEKQDKLKLCRIVRNYISHHADGEVFAAVSDEMITFIRALSTSLIADKLKAGDRFTDPLASQGDWLRGPEKERLINSAPEATQRQ